MWSQMTPEAQITPARNAANVTDYTLKVSEVNMDDFTSLKQSMEIEIAKLASFAIQQIERF